MKRLITTLTCLLPILTSHAQAPKRESNPPSTASALPMIARVKRSQDFVPVTVPMAVLPEPLRAPPKREDLPRVIPISQKDDIKLQYSLLLDTVNDSTLPVVYFGNANGFGFGVPNFSTEQRSNIHNYLRTDWSTAELVDVFYPFPGIGRGSNDGVRKLIFVPSISLTKKPPSSIGFSSSREFNIVMKWDGHILIAYMDEQTLAGALRAMGDKGDFINEIKVKPPGQQFWLGPGE